MICFFFLSQLIIWVGAAAMGFFFFSYSFQEELAEWQLMCDLALWICFLQLIVRAR